MTTQTIYPDNTKDCSKCKQRKPVSDFTPDKRSSTGFRASCRECTRVAAKQQHAKHDPTGEKRRAWQQDWRAKNTEHSNAIARKSMQKLKETDPLRYRHHGVMGHYKESVHSPLGQHILWCLQQRCTYCHAAPNSTYTNMGVDHVIPRAKGGSDSADNLVPCCTKCNKDKQHYTPEKFRALRIKKNIIRSAYIRALRAHGSKPNGFNQEMASKLSLTVDVVKHTTRRL